MTIFSAQTKLSKFENEIKNISKLEKVSENSLKEAISKGHCVVLKNRLRKSLSPTFIGNDLKVKVAATLSVNDNKESFKLECDKLRVAQETGVDCIFDMTFSSYIKEFRSFLIESSTVAVGNNPFLELAYESTLEEYGLINLTSKKMIDIVEKHCQEGIDFVSLNCGLTKALVEQFKKSEILSKITSRGAQILFDWIDKTELENPYYKYFDDLLDILKKYDVTLHLANAFKSGSIADSFDSLQIAEYAVIGELTRRANLANVQVMSDGIGHVAINKIPQMTGLIKEITLKIPLFVTSSFACDCAVGYDNISSSIANSLAASNGANLLSATSNVEYLAINNCAQLREGIISTKIAAHCADIANDNSKAIRQSYKMSFARKNENWKEMIKNSIDKSIF